MKPTVKVPLRLAPQLGVSKSLVQRWNKGTRRMPVEMAMHVVDILQNEGVRIDILSLKPDLERLILYLCRSHAKQRKLREEPSR